MSRRKNPNLEASPTLDERLRQTIRDSGISLNQLGQQVGIDNSQLSRFVRGARGLTLSAVEKLCRFFGLELAPSGAKMSKNLHLLVVRYARPIRHYLGEVLHNNRYADDIAQEVVERAFRDDLSAWRPVTGDRFRDYLKRLVDRVAEEYLWEKKSESKGLAIDFSPFRDQPPRPEFDQQWRDQWKEAVLRATWGRLKQYERQRPDAWFYSILRLHLAHPGSSAAQLSKEPAAGRALTPAVINKQLPQAWQMFADLLVIEVKETLVEPTQEQLDAELKALNLSDDLRTLLVSRRPKSSPVE